MKTIEISEETTKILECARIIVENNEWRKVSQDETIKILAEKYLE